MAASMGFEVAMSGGSGFRLRAAVGLAGALFVASAGVPRAEDGLRVRTWNAPPFSITDSAGHLTGFDVEIARALCDAIGAHCEIGALSFKEVLEALDRNTVDFAVASLLKTPERLKKYLFTERYWRSSSSFVGKIGAWPADTAPMLAGRRISVMAETKQHDYLRLNGSGCIIVPFDSHTEALHAVIAGTADLYLAPTIVSFQFLTGSEGQYLETVGEPLTTDGLGGDVGIALPPGQEALRDRLDHALRTILANGTYDAISSRFLPFRLY